MWLPDVTNLRNAFLTKATTRRSSPRCSGTFLRVCVPQASCSVGVFEPNLGSILAEYKPRRRQPSWRSRLKAALMSARWVKACGKLPKASPEGPISSA
jgi:hypothetical protein